MALLRTSLATYRSQSNPAASTGPLQPSLPMELLLIRPADAHPQSRQFDGPVSLALALALILEGPAEEVPGFTSISRQGLIRRCTAYCVENAKRNGLPVNSSATALWHAALKRQGLERGLRREDGTIADWLAGDVVVVLADYGEVPSTR